MIMQVEGNVLKTLPPQFYAGPCTRSQFGISIGITRIAFVLLSILGKAMAYAIQKGAPGAELARHPR
jgi:hypothetical protein